MRDGLLTTVEAAKMLGVSRAWITRMVKSGEIVGEKIGPRVVLVSEESVLENLRSYVAASRGKRGRGRPRSF